MSQRLEFNGPIVDGIFWDEADTKVKNLIYLILGAEGQRIYHQRFYHSVIDNMTAYPTPVGSNYPNAQQSTTTHVEDAAYNSPQY